MREERECGEWLLACTKDSLDGVLYSQEWNVVEPLPASFAPVGCITLSMSTMPMSIPFRLIIRRKCTE